MSKRGEDSSSRARYHYKHISISHRRARIQLLRLRLTRSSLGRFRSWLIQLGLKQVNRDRQRGEIYMPPLIIEVKYNCY